MLVNLAGDSDIAAGAVALDTDSLFLPASAWGFGCETPDVQAVATWRDLDVAAWVGRDECGRLWHEVTFVDDVIEVDAADSLSEDEAASYAVA